MIEQLRRRARRIAGPIEDEIRRLAIETHWSPTQIEDELGDRAPDVRTIRSIVAETRPPDPSPTDTWSLLSASPTEASAVMPVLRELVERTQGQRSKLSNSHAGWIAKIRATAPSLGLWETYKLAGMYASIARGGGSAAPLDQYLAFAPWTGADAQARYDGALQAGWIQPLFFSITSGDSGSGSESVTVEKREAGTNQSERTSRRTKRRAGKGGNGGTKRTR